MLITYSNPRPGALAVCICVSDTSTAELIDGGRGVAIDGRPLDILPDMPADADRAAQLDRCALVDALLSDAREMIGHAQHAARLAAALAAPYRADEQTIAPAALVELVRQQWHAVARGPGSTLRAVSPATAAALLDHDTAPARRVCEEIAALLGVNMIAAAVAGALHCPAEQRPIRLDYIAAAAVLGAVARTEIDRAGASLDNAQQYQTRTPRRRRSADAARRLDQAAHTLDQAGEHHSRGEHSTAIYAARRALWLSAAALFLIGSTQRPDQQQGNPAALHCPTYAPEVEHPPEVGQDTDLGDYARLWDISAARYLTPPGSKARCNDPIATA